MRLRRRLLPLALVSSASLAVVALATETRAGDEPASPPPAAAPSAADATDPAALRRAMLARLDAEADAAATRAHLAARIALDAVVPIPYLGVDADAGEGGMRVTHVYPRTSAQEAGLRAGDVLLEVGGARVASRADLGRAIRTARVGRPLRVRFRRDGKDLDASPSLGRRPEEDEDEDEQFPELAAAAGPSAAHLLRFEDAPAGSTPPAFEAVLGGHGAPPRYVVVEEAGARFLRQSDADPTGIRFPMAWLRDFAARDVVVRVRFRLVGGDADRAAGVVLRAKDAGNYLVVRANASEGDVQIFRTVSGLRRTLPGATVKAALDDGGWHALEVRAEGAKIRATLDGSATVESYDTYFGSGRVGLWTKSDSVSDFDDLAVEAVVAPERTK